MKANFVRQILKDFINLKFYAGIFNFIDSFIVLQNMEDQQKRKLISVCSAGVIHSLIAATVLTPIDVIKTYLMLEIAPKKTAMYQGFFKMFMTIFSKHGQDKFYNGFKLSLIHSILHSTLLLSTSFYLSLDKNVDMAKFVLLNFLVSGICYPIGTMT